MAMRGHEPGKTVTSKVLALLAAFEGGSERLRLSDMAARSGVAVSTAHRLVTELTTWGALQRGEDGRYQVGIRIWELGQHAARELTEVAHPYLHDLFELTRENVHLSIRQGTDVLYLERFYGSRRVPLIAQVGGRLPLHPTAVGKVILAYEEAWFRDTYLARTLERRTAFTITEPGRLSRELLQIRAQGYAVTREEIRLGTCSVAVPVLSAQGTCHAAIGIVMATGRAVELPRLVAPLQGTARRVEAALWPGLVKSRPAHSLWHA
ncbi:IclR family transcriptional regulator [Streptomyces bobili]|uniref:IclR family transcriptional regulator n=1 Tax=Streptomyces bobili TaxID=67280 RepID=UPI00382D1BC4